jgi:hypothetical protein
MYKLISTFHGQCVVRDNNNGTETSIPFNPDNTDYQQFVRDIKNGVQLNDAEGNPITGTALTTFIGTLP